MKKLLALLLAMMLFAGVLPALGETAPAEPEAAALPQAGETVHGFTVKEIRDFSMIGATLVLFEHEKTGARVMYIANEDTNRAFQLTFLTRPLDDTGLPHVFEHATLYGSEKYPSKTLLFNTTYQTYNTYINAYTTDAMTSYPLASLSEEQLLRLADWYTDSCFHPNIMTDESIYKTQAWHYEMADADSPLTLEGTVYSEMVGALTLDRVALDNANQLTFPGASISYQYGGMPAHIPEMTWDQLKSYHDLYYHPSNCIAFLYGDLAHYDAFLELLDREFSQYERREFPQAEEGYTPLTESVEKAFSYPAPAGTDTVNQSTVIYYILCPGLREQPEEESILDHLCLLLNAEGSPLMQNLKKALPTGAFSMGREVAAPVDAIVFSASHVGESDGALFRDTIQSSLQTMLEEGLAPDLLEARSAQIRLQNKLSGENSNPVVSVIQSLAYNAAVTGNPFAYPEAMESFENLEQENAEGKFTEAIRTWLLDPALYTLSTTSPAPGMKEEEDAALAARLAEIKAGMSQEEIEAIVAETNAQPAAEDNSALLASLKAVDVASLPEEIREYEIEDETGEDGARRINVTAGVDGVGMVSLYLDARALPLEDIHYMRLYTLLLGQMDTKAHSKEELSLLMDRYLYGRSISVGLNEGETPAEAQPWLVANWTCLDEDLAAGYDLMLELLRDTDFSDTQVLADRIAAQKAAVRSQISNAPYLVSLYRALGRGNMLFRYYAYLNCTDYYAFLESLEAKMAEDPAEVVAGLTRVQTFLLNRQGAVAGYAGSEDGIALNRPLADQFLSQLAREERSNPSLDLPAAAATEGIIVDTNSGFNTLAAPFSMLEAEVDESLHVAASIAADKILVPILRDQMGVYTPMCGIFGDNKGLYLISYRDPNVKETFDVYASLPDAIAQLNVDQETLDGYILSNYSALALPSGELSGAMAEVDRLVSGKDADVKLNRMRQLKQVTPESIQACAEIFRQLVEKGYRGTAAGAGTVNANADLYEVVLNPFGAVDAGAVTLQDVAEDREDYAAIRFAFENGLMTADENGVFAPDAAATVGDFYAAIYVLVGGAPGAQEEALAALPAYGLAPQMPGDTPLTFALRDQVMSALGAAVGMEIPAIGEGREEENMTRAQLAQDLTLFDDGQ